MWHACFARLRRSSVGDISLREILPVSTFCSGRWLHSLPCSGIFRRRSFQRTRSPTMQVRSCQKFGARSVNRGQRPEKCWIEWCALLPIRNFCRKTSLPSVMGGSLCRSKSNIETRSKVWSMTLRHPALPFSSSRWEWLRRTMKSVFSKAESRRRSGVFCRNCLRRSADVPRALRAAMRQSLNLTFILQRAGSLTRCTQPFQTSMKMGWFS